jgi:hypothetical protein
MSMTKRVNGETDGPTRVMVCRFRHLAVPCSADFNVILKCHRLDGLAALFPPAECTQFSLSLASSFCQRAP